MPDAMQFRSDFSGLIKIRRNSDNWGPFSFDLTGGIPEGVIIQDVEVQSFLV